MLLVVISRILLFLFGVGLGVPALADDVVPPPADTAASGTVEFSGRDIYERVLANRHSAYFQKQTRVSTDAGGAAAAAPSEATTVSAITTLGRGPCVTQRGPNA